jgi:hypothetical protein
MVKVSIAQLFGQSPISPLQEHMHSVLNAADGLRGFFEQCFNDDWAGAEAVYNEIALAENKADAEKKQIRLHLSRSLFMSIPRNDLLTMLSLQDQIANTAQDIAGVVLGRQLKFPQSTKVNITQFIDAAVKVVDQCLAVINGLDNLLETGFSESELSVIEALIQTLDDLEAKADSMEIIIRRDLMAIENDWPPIDVMFMYRVIELIGNLADGAQKTGDHVHIIVAR